MRWLSTPFAPLAVLSLALLLAGCPPPAQNPTNPSATDGKGGGGQPATDGKGGGGGGGDAPTEAAAPAAPPWEVVPAAQTETIYPMLQEARTWPAPTALRAPADLPEEKRPSAEKVRQLKLLVERVVSPELRPKDFDAAVGVDEKGRTFVRLGKEKAVGSASMEVRRVPEDKKFDFPVFTIVVEDDPPQGDQTLDRLKRRVRAVVVPGLGKEMDREEKGDTPYALVASPAVNGKDGVAAMAMLDRSGFGAQFPYLYAYGTAKHLLITVQEVPHMSLDGKAPLPPGQPPGGEKR